MKKIVFLIAFSFVIITSCKKEDNVRPDTKEVVPNALNDNGTKVIPPHDGGK